MEITIISLKLLFFSILTAFVVLLIKAIIPQPNTLTLCNEQGKMDMYIRYQGTDFVINPTSLKNITYCLGKSMPFYDRTIEYVINPGSGVESGLNDRYKIANVVNKGNILLNQYKLAINKQSVTLSSNNRSVVIFKRQVSSPFDLFPHGLRGVLSVIRPRSSDTIEGVLNEVQIEQKIINQGEYFTADFTRLTN